MKPIFAAAAALMICVPLLAGATEDGTGPALLAPGLILPEIDAERGRRLFAEKGCVVCHSINGLGGDHAPALDAASMEALMNPFEFAARMWRGAQAMLEQQEAELGGRIDLTGEDLADIIAFTHDAQEQEKFSMADIPHEMQDLMRHGGDDHHDDGAMDDHHEKDDGDDDHHDDGDGHSHD